MERVRFNFAHYRRDHKSIDSIPNWAKKSLQEHAEDERKSYTFEGYRKCSNR